MSIRGAIGGRDCMAAYQVIAIADGFGLWLRMSLRDRRVALDPLWIAR
jgi:hypothetical protein